MPPQASPRKDRALALVLAGKASPKTPVKTVGLASLAAQNIRKRVRHERAREEEQRVAARCGVRGAPHAARRERGEVRQLERRDGGVEPVVVGAPLVGHHEQDARPRGVVPVRAVACAVVGVVSVRAVARAVVGVVALRRLLARREALVEARRDRDGLVVQTPRGRAVDRPLARITPR